MSEDVTPDVMDALQHVVDFVSTVVPMAVWDIVLDAENRVPHNAADALEIAVQHVIHIAVKPVMMHVWVHAKIRACKNALIHVLTHVLISASDVRLHVHKTVCISVQDQILEFQHQYVLMYHNYIAPKGYNLLVLWFLQPEINQ